MRLYDNDAYREDFIEVAYDLLSDDVTNDRANQIIEAFDAAPCVDAEVLPPNAPLTLDELRGMEGDPVWAVKISESTFFHDAWMLVTEYGAIDRKQSMTFCEYGKTWLAYRHKPEEGTK